MARRLCLVNIGAISARMPNTNGKTRAPTLLKRTECHMQLQIILGGFLAIVSLYDSVLRLLRANFNFGTFLLYCITAALWIYAISQPIDLFCAQGFGRVLKYGFFAGCIALMGIIAFLAISGYAQNWKP